MNQFLASAILAAVVLALVYVFMRVMRLDKEVKELRNRAPPMDLAQAVWGMASEPPPSTEVHFAPPQVTPEMYATHLPASNEALVEEELQEEEELIEAFQEAAPPEVPSAPPEPSDAPLEQPVVNPNPTATPVRRPTMRKKKQPVASEE